MDVTVVDGREATVTFITGTGTGAADVDVGIKRGGCVVCSAGAKILVSSGSGNNGRGKFPILPPCTTLSGSQADRRLALANSLLGLELL